MEFTPNTDEEKILGELNKVVHFEFALVRLTRTMLKKSIIDASAHIRSVLSNYHLVDYATLTPGVDKIMGTAKILMTNIQEEKVSFYRPKTKKGDPRFCIYNLRKYIREDQMFYLTVFNRELVVIPLVQSLIDLDVIKKFFNITEENPVKDELIRLLSALKKKGPVKSVSPYKSNSKDIGDTLERELGILPNSSKIADFKSQVEIKAKRADSKTKDTLFSMVPDWKKSIIKSASEMILTFGYDSKKYPNFKDLYVTVHSKPNNQGLRLEVDEENGYLNQVTTDSSGKDLVTCIWPLDTVKSRLYRKHPETVWVVGTEVVISGEIHFIFDKVEYTRSPIFSSFLLLISQNRVTYDWRGRVKLDGTGYKDKGHCFRLNPKYRNLLFGEIQTIEL
ncbi:MvaI/BcnI family restriction endonuclease [Bacillus halotolerans]|uniref:MvaI/BcnI family restriction endonuclease n=1 Tax=Bacillus halotolerans TaxID=260554 RepID=UPI00227EFDFA|nr:MvaI/BcnI family restriction endonuclease [Bacillus halotolerans]MCY8979870.1 MvaI/BcnI family restriction endonuclease [Bacillus halotolerans]